MNFQISIGFVCVRPSLPSQIGQSLTVRTCHWNSGVSVTFSARITFSVNPGQNGFLGITHDVSRAGRPSAPPCRARLVLVIIHLLFTKFGGIRARTLRSGHYQTYSIKGLSLNAVSEKNQNEQNLKNSTQMSALTVCGWGGMLSLCLETIRGSFLTENSGILKGFWTRYQRITMKIPILSQKHEKSPTLCLW